MIPAIRKDAMSSVKAESFTVAIITRNRPEALQRVLLSLISQLILPTNVLVINNSASDDAERIVESFKEYLSIHCYKEPQVGIASARNRALKEAKDTLLAFLDDDCCAKKNWIYEMILAHQNYPRAIAIQGEAVSKGKKEVYTIISQFHHNRWIANYLQKSNTHNQNTFSALDTKNVVLNLKQIRKLHLGFDNHLIRNSDMDFANKLLAKGKKIIYHPNAYVYHFERDSFLSFLYQNWQRGRGWIQLMRKWPKKYFVFSWRLYMKRNIFFFRYTKNQKITKKYFLLFFFFQLYLQAMWLGQFFERVKQKYRKA